MVSEALRWLSAAAGLSKADFAMLVSLAAAAGTIAQAWFARQQHQLTKQSMRRKPPFVEVRLSPKRMEGWAKVQVEVRNQELASVELRGFRVRRFHRGAIVLDSAFYGTREDRYDVQAGVMRDVSAEQLSAKAGRYAECCSTIRGVGDPGRTLDNPGSTIVMLYTTAANPKRSVVAEWEWSDGERR